MHSHARKPGRWGLRWMFKHERSYAVEPLNLSGRALHETRRSILRKLSAHFAKERADHG